ncbi:uncharacterized protein [Clytia hemisphaerica]|uniref:Glutamine amidotransferase domain-containing protein n=1 Tax=Clytia hemisphaerica TaxID=252671 RepID=A0A7M5XNE3_9CNID
MSCHKKIGVLLYEDDKKAELRQGHFWWENCHKPRCDEIPNIGSYKIQYEPLFVSENPSILGQINFDEYYGFLLTGSSHSVNKDTFWVQELSKFVRKCFEIGHIRIFGICFGHQMIAKVLDFQSG